MAKISARGAREVAKVKGEHRFAGDDGRPTHFLYVLTSDGRILSRLVGYENEDGTYSKVAGGYSVDRKNVAFATNPAPVDPQHPLNVLSLYVERKGAKVVA